MPSSSTDSPPDHQAKLESSNHRLEDSDLQAVDVQMAFGGVPVLKGVSVSFRGGEVHGLLGENGAGKSTLAKILSGIVQPNQGQIILQGAKMRLRNPQAARRAGIALIPQEPLVFPDLQVMENLFAGNLLRKGFPPRLDWSSMRLQTENLLKTLGASIAPQARVGNLSVADQQLVEMASALSHKVRVLILDETTASLTPHEVKKLFSIVNHLKEQGVAIVMISHRMEEIFSICDRLTVLRDGEKVAELPTRSTNVDDVLRLMVGRKSPQDIAVRKAVISGAPLLKVESLCGEGFQEVTLHLRRGEILGLAGLVGAGRSEFSLALAGMTRPRSGKILLTSGGTEHSVSFGSPADARKVGIVYLPEDRQTQGNLAQLSVRENLTLSSLRPLSRLGMIQKSREFRITNESIRNFGVRCTSSEQAMAHLSGGNQQKVILARTLMSDPDILILDEPTRGIDLAAKREVHSLVQKWADQGKAILLISSDLPEVMALSDRIAVMREGRLVDEFTQVEASAEKIISAATGTTPGMETPDSPENRVHTAGFFPSGRSVFAFRELGIVVFLLTLFAAGAIFSPDSLTVSNLRSVALWIPLLIVLGIGQLAVILSRGIDVSAGSIVAVSGISAGLIFREFPQLHYGWGCLVSIFAGTLLGAVNGGLVGWAKIPPIIATLGTLSAFRGLAFILSQGKQIDPHEIPSGLLALSREGIFGWNWFPVVLLISLILAVAGSYVLNLTSFGRHVYAIGGNAQAAFARGISVGGTSFFVYLLSGTMAGVAAVIYASRFGFVNPGTTGIGLELTAIAAVVVGGANIFGGSGKISGMILGCLLLGTIHVALAILGVAGTFQLAVYGAIILLAIMMDHGLQVLMNRKRKGTRAR